MQAGNDFENIKKIEFVKNNNKSLCINAPFNDTITRIRNGYLRRDLLFIHVIKSNFILSILEKLFQLKYIGPIEVGDREIKVNLIRDNKRDPKTFFIKTYSSPSRRLSCSYRNIPRRRFGQMGHTLLSTNKGILTDKQAKEMKVGGELLLEVYWCQR